MSLLLSNFPPLKTNCRTYHDVFREYLQSCTEINIATGYVSVDSLIDLKSMIELNSSLKINLCIGMHYFEGLTPTQHYALENLDYELRNRNVGQVYMVVTFPFHAKLVSFSHNKRDVAAIIGSSNLSNIIYGTRQYEADVLYENVDSVNQIHTFIQEVINKCSKPLSEVTVPTKSQDNFLLEGHINVEKLNATQLATVRENLTNISFTLPLKGDESHKSGLNTSFGKGRENQQGFILPRSWYEVELIIPKAITEMPDYPKADSSGENGSFSVITDDGWTFRCKVSGTNSKNLRSESDLKILGKWLKGRLENNGNLNPGDRVNDETFINYGRSNITMIKIKNSNDWYLDFGV